MSLTGYNKTREDVREILQPVESALGALGINSTTDCTVSPAIRPPLFFLLSPPPPLQHTPRGNSVA